jgi:hypothetical protein
MSWATCSSGLGPRVTAVDRLAPRDGDAYGVGRTLDGRIGIRAVRTLAARQAIAVLEHDPAEPRRKRPRLAYRRQRPIGLDERFLGDIFGQMVVASKIDVAYTTAMSWYARKISSKASSSPACP